MILLPPWSETIESVVKVGKREWLGMVGGTPRLRKFVEVSDIGMGFKNPVGRILRGHFFFPS